MTGVSRDWCVQGHPTRSHYNTDAPTSFASTVLVYSEPDATSTGVQCRRRSEEHDSSVHTFLDQVSLLALQSAHHPGGSRHASPGRLSGHNRLAHYMHHHSLPHRHNLTTDKM